MIRSFATKETAALFANQRVRRFDGEWLPVARRKLAQLNASALSGGMAMPGRWRLLIITEEARS